LPKRLIIPYVERRLTDEMGDGAEL